MKNTIRANNDNTAKSVKPQETTGFWKNDHGLRYLDDPALREIVYDEKMPPKKRMALAKKLFKWSMLLNKSVSQKAKVQIENFDCFLTDVPNGMWSVFEEEPDLKKYDTATIGRIMARYKFWAEELELEIKRRLAEKQLGNPQN